MTLQKNDIWHLVLGLAVAALFAIVLGMKAAAVPAIAVGFIFQFVKVWKGQSFNLWEFLACVLGGIYINLLTFLASWIGPLS